MTTLDRLKELFALRNLRGLITSFDFDNEIDRTFMLMDLATISDHIEQQEKRIGEIIHLHEVSLGLAELDCLDEITDENVQEYSDLKLYEKWQKKLNKEAGE